VPRNETPKYAIKLKDTSDKIWEVDSDSSSGKALYQWWERGGSSATCPGGCGTGCQLICVQMYRNRFGPNTTGVATITAAGVVISLKDPIFGLRPS